MDRSKIFCWGGILLGAIGVSVVNYFLYTEENFEWLFPTGIVAVGIACAGGWLLGLSKRKNPPN